MGLRAQLGWHTSIGDYSNEAAQNLNGVLGRKLQDHQIDLDYLGAVMQVGLEMEAVWALNDYADAEVGNNQFKLPALWKTMDTLLGITCYTDCMSGKDRTGKVESAAAEFLDEINMNLLDQKARLEQKFNALNNSPAWNRHKETLTKGCFKESDLESLNATLREQGEDAFNQRVQSMVNSKFQIVQNALGNFLESKNNIPRGFFNRGVDGIPTNTPKMLGVPRAMQEAFPRLATSSMYETSSDRQREAENRRLSQLSGSLAITQMNTGTPGFKVEGGEPLARYASGFDRDYVLERLSEPDLPDFHKTFERLLGLHELTPKKRDKYLQKLHQIYTSQSPEKIKAYTRVLRKIEQAKLSSLCPQVHVNA